MLNCCGRVSFAVAIDSRSSDECCIKIRTWRVCIGAMKLIYLSKGINVLMNNVNKLYVPKLRITGALGEYGMVPLILRYAYMAARID